MKKFTLSAVFLALALIIAPGAIHAQDTTTTPPPPMEEPMEEPMAEEGVVATLEARGNFSTLLGALEQTGLAQELQNAEAVTIFAPTDEAFAALPEGTLEELGAEELANILQYHVTTGAVMLEQAAQQGSAQTMQGGTLTFEQMGGSATVNGAAISEADVAASNGVIHVVDAVLMPEEDGGMTDY